MTDDQIKQQQMCATVARFITDRAEEIDVVDAAHDEAADVTAANATLEAALGKGIIQTKDVTLAANKAERQLQVVLPALLGPMASIATKGKDIKLLAQATLRVKQIRNLTPTQLYELTGELLTIAAGHPAETIKHYGLTAVLPIITGYQNDLKPLIGQTQDLIDDRSTDNVSVDDLLLATLQQLRELDKVMLVFKVLNPTLHADYKKARRVGTRGGGGKKGGGQAPKG